MKFQLKWCVSLKTNPPQTVGSMNKGIRLTKVSSTDDKINDLEIIKEMQSKWIRMIHLIKNH